MPKIKVIPSIEDHPLVEFDEQSNVLRMEGICMPENAIEMFAPVFDKMSELMSDSQQLGLHMHFKYLNSMSSKQILRLLLLVSASGTPYEIKWFYSPDDDLMRFKGEEFKTILNENPHFYVVESEESEDL